MLTLKQITRREELDALVPGWNRIWLHQRLPPFLSHSWTVACIEAYGAGKTLAVATVWDKQELVGIAPLWTYLEHRRGLMIRVLGFITCPDTTMADFIVDGADRERVLRLIYDFIRRPKSGNWDIACLSRWPQNSPNYTIIRKIADMRKEKMSRMTDSVIPYVPIHANWESFLQTRSAKFRKTRRNIENRITRLEGVAIELYTDGVPAKAMEDILAVSSKGWKNSQGVSMSSSSQNLHFFRLLTQLAAQAGWLYLWLLRVNEQAIAVEYDLLTHGCVYALRADFDPAFRDVSPGTYLETQILKDVFRNGHVEYCTGPGLNEYKLHLTDQFLENVSLTLYRRTRVAIMLWILEGLVLPKLRALREVLKKLRRPENEMSIANAGKRNADVCS